MWNKYNQHPGGVPPCARESFLQILARSIPARACLLAPTKMGSTYYSLHYHWVCSMKLRRRYMRSPWRSPFHAYLGSTIRGLEGVPLKTGGVEDHVHMVFGLKPSHVIADVVRELKKASSIWAAQEYEQECKWQEGYSIFSVGDYLDDVIDYVSRQEEHHQTLTFEEEIKGLLERHGIKPQISALKMPALAGTGWHPSGVLIFIITSTRGLRCASTPGYRCQPSGVVSQTPVRR